MPVSDPVSGRTLSYSATGLPTGTSIDPASGVVSGLLTAAGYFRPTVTARDTAGRTNDESFIWYVAPAQVSGSTGPIMLSGRCLDADSAGLAACRHSATQQWTLSAGATVEALNRCLTDNGSSVALADCSGNSSQQWRVVSFGGLRNVASGQCLAAAGVASCSAGADQRWDLPPGALVSGVVGGCADSTPGTTARLQMWYCGDPSVQAWTVRPDGTLRDAGTCLSAGSTVVLARCDGSAGQQWHVQPDGSVVSQLTATCLADSADRATAGSPLELASCAATIQQRWHIE